MNSWRWVTNPMQPIGSLLCCLVICSGNASLVGQATQSKDPPATAPRAAGEPNGLARETSPYLQSHAENPVNWYPWGEPALRRARDENKLIFLSIGYSSCHWCHVMERESFVDPEIAAFLNQHFICIKVDREERPDVDRIYMESLLLYNQLRGSRAGGGWPLSLFLLPDSRPFFGGSYFPARDGDRGVKNGFLSIIQRIHELDQQDRAPFLRDAEIITTALAKQLVPPPATEDRSITVETTLDEAITNLLLRFDPQYGGFEFSENNDQIPKFPQPPRLMFLVSQLPKTKHHAKLLEALRLTSQQLTRGGIYDHLGGGWHRYSVDRYWRVPHFEKMLYDNAQLISWYSRLHTVTDNPRAREVVEQTIEFLRLEMQADSGGFYTAIDADSEGREGAYYVWTADQIRSAVGESNYPFAKKCFGLDQPPHFLEKEYVLQRSVPLPELATSFNLSEAEASERVTTIRKQLLTARALRERPQLDYKILTADNGLVIRGLADAGRAFDRHEYLELARNTARFVLSKLSNEQGELYRTYTQGQPSIRAYLDDYSQLIDGLIGLHEATGESLWLEEAVRLQTIQNRLFWDETGKGFFFAETRDQTLIAQIKEIADSVTPAGNNVSAGNLLYLAQHTDRPQWQEMAQQIGRMALPLLYEYPESAPRLLSILEQLQ